MVVMHRVTAPYSDSRRDLVCQARDCLDGRAEGEVAEAGMKLDQIDLRILDAIQRDACITRLELAEKAGLSPTPIITVAARRP